MPKSELIKVFLFNPVFKQNADLGLLTDKQKKEQLKKDEKAKRIGH